jgi:hypothetical protein
MTLLATLVRAMGAATVLFGAAPALAPRFFARMFALPVESDPRLLVMVRSVGVRDVAIGLGLFMAARSGNAADYAPWLAARIASDVGDTVAIGIAMKSGSRQPRFVGLGLLALAASLTGLVLDRLRRA